MLNWFNKKFKLLNFKKNLSFHKIPLILIFGSFGSFFSIIFSKMIVIKPDGLYIGQANAWGDWAVHLSITTLFANKPMNEWFLYHPFFAEGKLTYGFLVHLITALFMKIGVSLPGAFFIVSLTILFFLLLGLYLLYFQLSNSRKASVLAIFLFFSSSGMGVFRFWQELNLQKIFMPTQDYSRFVEYEWLAGNIPAAMLIPQRAFFIGVTIGIWVIILLLWGIKTKSIQQKKFLFFAGFLAGILPIAHMHSFITICIVTGTICLFNLAKFRQISTYFVLPAGVLSSLLYFKFIHGGIQIDSFMTILLGWTVPKSSGLLATVDNWFFMWLQLWGTFLPTAFFALLYLYKKIAKTSELAFYSGFILVFFLANSVVFQPTKWDNTKLFAWVYLGLCILVAQFILKLWKINVLHKILVFILIITLSTTGMIEIFRIGNISKNTHLLSTASEIVFAKKIASNTATDAIFLTGTAHNHPIPLWANRPIFLGYLGWIRNFGFDSSMREKQLHLIFSGDSQADTLIKENKISYIFVGPKEKNTLKINQKFLEKFPIAFHTEDTIVYDTRQLWQ